ncbi:hypothetical protein [Egicoccus halophilus]|uniref:Uncharacterized protein n=1 Tax=Egicoccus halophilus TaxID=1670830 RepID=A0A8J3EYA8_9ACTN|nr:hypothetical protein [Egicoccus halophilus]GGI07512.1 hypothetical protein GCM10011354_24470 [Egicoccus halophilus]
MKLYADPGPRLATQVAGDLAALASVVVTVRVATRLREQVLGFGVAADRVQSSGERVSSGASAAGTALTDLPLVGGALSAPFEVVADAGRDLAAAGSEAGGSLDGLAALLPALLVAVVVGYLVAHWLPARVAWVREVAEVQRLGHTPDADRLLAHRALARRPLHELRRDGADPVADLAAGHWTSLADLERRALGLTSRPDRRRPIG